MATLRDILPTAAALVVAIACTTVAREASATPNFPDEIKAHEMLNASPACAICHQGGVTGLGTVTTPFGKSMRARGLVPFDLGSLDSALDQMNSGNVSSVGDGTSDINKLKMGLDPNLPFGDAGANIHIDTPLIPEYGCGAHIAPAGDAGDAWTISAAAMIMGLVGLRVRRRRR